jgi:hypothetical protein
MASGVRVEVGTRGASRVTYMFRDAMLKLLLANTLHYAKLIAD